jgi:hypothetical protein
MPIFATSMISWREVSQRIVPVNDGDGAQCSFIGIMRLIGEPEAATQDF